MIPGFLPVYWLSLPMVLTILRSRDRGARWDVFPTEFRMGGNEDGRGRPAGRVYVGTDGRGIVYGDIVH